MANRLLTELVLQDKNFGSGIQSAKQKLDSFNGTGNGVKATIGQLGKVLGVNIGTLTKLGTVAGAAGIALKGMQEIIKHNTALSDDYDRVQKQVNATVNAFWTTLGNGSFSSFINGLDNIITKAGEARDALDDLQVTSFYLQNANKQLTQKYRTYMDKARDTSLSKEARQKYLDLAKEVAVQISKNTKIETQKGGYSNRKSLQDFMTQGGYDHDLTQDKKTYYLNPQNGLEIEKIANQGKEIKAIVDKYDMRSEEFINQKLKEAGYNMTYGKWIGGYTKYHRAMAWESQRNKHEDTVQGFYDVSLAAGEATENLANMNRQMSRASDQINKKTSSGGGSTSSSTPKSVPESYAKIDYDLGVIKPKDVNTLGYYIQQVDILQEKLKDETLTSKQYVELQLKLDKAEQQLKLFKEGKLFEIPTIEVEVELKKAGVKSVSELVAEQQEITAQKAEDTKNAWNVTTSLIQQAGGAMSSLGNEGANIAGMIAQAVATIAVAYADTLAKDKTSKSNIYSFIAAAASATISMAATIAQMHKATGYANGGIIGGNSYSGDRLYARVNSGEMILNSKQQANLWKEINNPVNSSNPLVNGKVEFEIKNQRLVGTLNNYSKKQSRL